MSKNDNLKDLVNVKLEPDILKAINLFYRLDAADRGAALERMRIMLKNDKYLKQKDVKKS